MMQPPDAPAAETARTRPGLSRRGVQRSAAWFLLLGCAGMLLPGRAEVHRYQDADGNWVYSDRAPVDTSPTQQPVATPPRLEPGHDLAQRLEDAFLPRSAVEASTLAVVQIRTPLGTGSGFFVSPDGLILSTRHLVRPPADWARKQENYVEVLKAQLEDLERELAEPGGRYADPQTQARGTRLLQARQAEYREARRELEMRRHVARQRDGFEVRLKDGTALAAELVEASSTLDLALLQVRGYKTPFIPAGNSGQVRDQDALYAIVGTLGVADSIRPGMLSGRRGGGLIIDVHLADDDSGAPLVTRTGEVIGISTLAATGRDAPAERGGAFAIPIERALERFSDLRR